MKKLIFLGGIVLLFSMVFLTGCGEDAPTVAPSEHFEPEGWIIRDATQKPILVVWQGYIQTNWQGHDVSDTLFAPLNALSDHLTAKFLDINKNIINPPSDADHSLSWTIADTSKLGIIQDNPTDWAFHLKGKKNGRTTLELFVMHVGHVDVRTPIIPVVIREDTINYGKAVSIKLFYEDSGVELANADATTSSGGIIVQKDSTTDHIAVEFKDEYGHSFQPEYPLFSLSASVSDSSVAEVIPQPNEPWVIRIKGLQTGIINLNLTLIVSGVVEFAAFPITINVN